MSDDLIFSRRIELDRLLSKIPNGKERYNESALVHTVFTSLAQGQDPIQLIDQLITIHENLQNKYKEFISKIPASYVINPVDINKP